MIVFDNEKTEENSGKILSLSEILQLRSHSYIRSILEKSSKKVEYQDATNTVLYVMIAELKNEIERLSNKVEELTEQIKQKEE